jgi:hypothetical protein
MWATGTRNLPRRERARERRVGVAEDHDCIRLLLEEHCFDRRQQAAGLLAVRARPGLQPVRRGWELELGLDRRTGVDEDPGDTAFAQRPRERSRCEELWPVADDGKDSHAAGECSQTL